MKQNCKLLLLGILCQFHFLIAQEEISVEEKEETRAKNKEIGVNMTTFVSQFVPFGSNFPKGGPFGYSFKKYGSKAAFRFGLGMSVAVEENEEDINLHIRLGYERRKKLNDRWAYTRGLDFALMAGNWNIPGISTGLFSTAIGFGPVIGIEYYIFPNVYLSTESYIFFGYGGDGEFDSGPVFRILPPTGLMLNVRI
ncbi:MAG: hypothetical protein WAS56_12835 [Saprospiraceae bacterium]|nr:hypothetical protein [Saprospiraceae bacterium]MBK9994719.1 hypothetical protein [Saprospiraceae bacterium]